MPLHVVLSARRADGGTVVVVFPSGYSMCSRSTTGTLMTGMEIARLVRRVFRSDTGIVFVINGVVAVLADVDGDASFEVVLQDPGRGMGQSSVALGRLVLITELE